MPSSRLVEVVERADRLINARRFDELMDFYCEDATLVVRPGQNACGRAAIRRAFDAIDEHFLGRLRVRQSALQVVEAGDTALVLARAAIAGESRQGPRVELRKATYVFRREADAQWRCLVDNSYGVELLDTLPMSAMAVTR